jgi:hypothetical protein
MSSRYPYFKEIPFTNRIGQTVNVGDRVVVVTTGYCHRVNVREGVFLGVTNNHPTIQVIEDSACWVAPDGSIGRWKDGAKYEKRRRTIRRTLQADRVFALK